MIFLCHTRYSVRTPLHIIGFNFHINFFFPIQYPCKSNFRLHLLSCGWSIPLQYDAFFFHFDVIVLVVSPPLPSHLRTARGLLYQSTHLLSFLLVHNTINCVTFLSQPHFPVRNLYLNAFSYSAAITSVTALPLLAQSSTPHLASKPR